MKDFSYLRRVSVKANMNCTYIFMFAMKNAARKGLDYCHISQGLMR